MAVQKHSSQLGNPVTKMANFYGLVMAGGSGTRLWPESTQKCPKQYLQLHGRCSLLENTLLRLEGIIEKNNRFLITVTDQEKLAQEKAQSLIGPENLILEPAARNTAPCILLSLAKLLIQGAQNDDVVAILPADHVILNKAGFQQSLQEAFQMASQLNKIVTIGIPPYFPHTGYGYILKGQSLEAGHAGFEVSEFREKPDFQTAQAYVASGEYFWNAGIFVASIGVLLQEFSLHAPEVHSFLPTLLDTVESPSQKERLKDAYQKMPAISVDYAVMEKSRHVAVASARFDWNDLGSWEALESVCEKTEGNVLIPSENAKYYFNNAKGNIIVSRQEKQFVALVNVQDLVIVNNDKALLIVPKKDSQKIKEVVEHLRKQDEQSYL